eukprot:tig00021293_g20015.t1
MSFLNFEFFGALSSRPQAAAPPPPPTLGTGADGEELLRELVEDMHGGLLTFVRDPDYDRRHDAFLDACEQLCHRVEQLVDSSVSAWEALPSGQCGTELLSWWRWLDPQLEARRDAYYRYELAFPGVPVEFVRSALYKTNRATEYIPGLSSCRLIELIEDPSRFRRLTVMRHKLQFFMTKMDCPVVHITKDLAGGRYLAVMAACTAARGGTTWAFEPPYMYMPLSVSVIAPSPAGPASTTLIGIVLHDEGVGRRLVPAARAPPALRPPRPAGVAAGPTAPGPRSGAAEPDAAPLGSALKIWDLVLGDFQRSRDLAAPAPRPLRPPPRPAPHPARHKDSLLAGIWATFQSAARSSWEWWQGKEAGVGRPRAPPEEADEADSIVYRPSDLLPAGPCVRPAPPRPPRPAPPARPAPPRPAPPGDACAANNRAGALRGGGGGGAGAGAGGAVPQGRDADVDEQFRELALPLARVPGVGGTLAVVAAPPTATSPASGAGRGQQRLVVARRAAGPAGSLDDALARLLDDMDPVQDVVLDLLTRRIEAMALRSALPAHEAPRPLPGAPTEAASPPLPGSSRASGDEAATEGEGEGHGPPAPAPSAAAPRAPARHQAGALAGLRGRGAGPGLRGRGGARGVRVGAGRPSPLPGVQSGTGKLVPPPNAWILFYRSKRQEMVQARLEAAQRGEASRPAEGKTRHGEMLESIRAAWRTASEAERAPFEKMARAAQEAFKAAFPNYKFKRMSKRQKEEAAAREEQEAAALALGRPPGALRVLSAPELLAAAGPDGPFFPFLPASLPPPPLVLAPGAPREEPPEQRKRARTDALRRAASPQAPHSWPALPGPGGGGAGARPSPRPSPAPPPPPQPPRTAPARPAPLPPPPSLLPARRAPGAAGGPGAPASPASPPTSAPGSPGASAAPGAASGTSASRAPPRSSAPPSSPRSPTPTAPSRSRPAGPRGPLPGAPVPFLFSAALGPAAPAPPHPYAAAARPAAATGAFGAGRGPGAAGSAPPVPPSLDAWAPPESAHDPFAM